MWCVCLCVCGREGEWVTEKKYRRWDRANWGQSQWQTAWDYSERCPNMKTGEYPIVWVTRSTRLWKCKLWGPSVRIWSGTLLTVQQFLMVDVLTGILGVPKFYFKAQHCHYSLSIQNYAEKRTGRMWGRCYLLINSRVQIRGWSLTPNLIQCLHSDHPLYQSAESVGRAIHHVSDTTLSFYLTATNLLWHRVVWEHRHLLRY